MIRQVLRALLDTLFYMDLEMCGQRNLTAASLKIYVFWFANDIGHFHLLQPARQCRRDNF